MPTATPPTPPVIPAETFRSTIERELVPLLPGAELKNDSHAAAAAKKLVMKLGQNVLGVRSSKADPAFLKIGRTHPFSPSEIKLADLFIQTLGEISSHHSQFFFNDALTAAVRRTIVKSLGYPNEALLLRVLSEFEALASQTYEGHRIAAVVGLDDKPVTTGVKLDAIWGQDFGKVLTGSIETIITVSPDGFISQFRDLYTDASLATAPHYARTIAEWCTGKRLAVSLNRNGEILLFREKGLVFAWRRGRWRHFVHEPVMAQMKTVQNKELRRCIFETILDVSFGRTGGCIGVVQGVHKSHLRDVVNKDDRVAKGETPKAQVLTQFLDQPEHKRLFTLLPRRLRQAMAAIDGALVLNHKGEVLAVGAIVRVESGSDAGARKAAAKALARMGFGVKISADGGVTGFGFDQKSKSVRRIFEFA